MVRIEFEKIIRETDCDLAVLQKIVLKEISDTFGEVRNLKIKSTEGVSNRGKYDTQTITQLNITFDFYNHSFQFYLFPDQLEYYIKSGNTLLFECNLEDFWEEKEHSRRFMNFLTSDLEKIIRDPKIHHS